MVIYLTISALLSSCSKVAPTDVKPTSKVNVVTSTEISTEKPLITPLPTPSPRPTRSDMQLKTFFDLLQDDKCLLPCYLGIVPGKTTMDDASTILQNTGASIYAVMEYPYQNSSIQGYSYSLDIEAKISQSIKLFVYDGIVFRMEVYVGSPFDQLFYKYWSKFSIPAILKSHGQPDAVYTAYNPHWEKQILGNNVAVLYHDPGIYIGNQGLPREDNLVCPGIRDGITQDIFRGLKQRNLLSVLSELRTIMLIRQ